MSCPGISVIIPTRNNGPELGRAIRSVLAQDAITRGKCSVEIIINDASEARHLPFLRQLPNDYPHCRLLHLDKPAGPSAARNAGISDARGDFISFLDADDEWPDNKLSLLLPFFSDTSVEIAGGKIQYILDEGLSPLAMRYEDSQNRLTHVHLGAILARKSVFFTKRLVFDESLRFSEDIDWWYRLRENNTGIVLCEATTLLYHVHGNNMSFEKRIDDLQLLKVLHKSLTRRKNIDINQAIPQLKDFRVQQEDPLISIIIPLYNGRHLIDETIEGVLSQTYKNRELVVVDDGSADAGGDYVRQRYPDIKVIRQENAGVAAARNEGIRQAKGEILAFLDQDDRWLPDKLSEQWNLLKTDPYCAFVTCNHRYLLRGEVALPANFSKELFKEHRSLVPSALLIRKHALLSVNGFDESLVTCSDTDLIRKLRNAGFKEKNVNRLLLEKWYHGANASLDKETMRREFLAVLHKQTKTK